MTPSPSGRGNLNDAISRQREMGLEQPSPATRPMVSWLPLPLAGEGWGEGAAAAQECSTTTELIWITGTVSV